jgi:PhnB protein
MIKLNNFIDFNGNAKEAIAFYIEVFKTKSPNIVYFKDVPSKTNLTLEDEQRVAHANLQIAGFTIMISDTDRNNPIKVGENITFFIQCDDLDEQKIIYEKLKENATLMIPLSETFWSKSYAYLIDQFGIGWQLNYDAPERKD